MGESGAARRLSHSPLPAMSGTWEVTSQKEQWTGVLDRVLILAQPFFHCVTSTKSFSGSAYSSKELRFDEIINKDPFTLNCSLLLWCSVLPGLPYVCSVINRCPFPPF